jgi:flagellum-specific ATP synthase
LADGAQRKAATQLRRWLGALSSNRDLIAVGAYQSGADADTDEALLHQAKIERFLSQAVEQAAPLTDARRALAELTGTLP